MKTIYTIRFTTYTACANDNESLFLDNLQGFMQKMFFSVILLDILSKTKSKAYKLITVEKQAYITILYNQNILYYLPKLMDIVYIIALI